MGFPSYSTACKCKINDWKNNCISKFSDRSKAYHYCATYSGGKSAGVKEVERKVGFTVHQDQSIQNRLVHGMYKPQISSYARKFPRSHILIMDFDRLLNNQEKYIKKMVEFYGLPYSEHKHKLKELPAENEKLFGGKVKTVACSTRRRLDNIW